MRESLHRNDCDGRVHESPRDSRPDVTALDGS